MGVTVLVTALLVAFQFAASFLYNAPSNVISKAYASQISWWMTPLQMQNWELFAPNPLSENVVVEARASVGPSAVVTPWIDLSAIDASITDGDPAPSHVTMNALRNAWLKFIATHNSAGVPNTDAPLAGTMQSYLENLVLTYLRPRETASIDSVQVRFVTTLLPGDGRTAAQTAPQTQTLPWWLVTQ